MQAVIQRRYGSADDLELREIPKPTPDEDEVLVRVRAASVNPDVWHVLTGLPYVLRLFGAGLRRPKNPVPGTDVAGIVEAVGSRVESFRPGDEVFGEVVAGYQWKNGGAYAEYLTTKPATLVPKPAHLTFEQAAVVTPALIALRNTGCGRLFEAGQHVLVNGAGGNVGRVALQLARARGAVVTAVDLSGKLELLRTLGADHVIDGSREDFTQQAHRYDVVLDVPGNRPFSMIRRVLTPGGRYVLIAHDKFGEGMNRWLGQIPHMLGLMARSTRVPELRNPHFQQGYEEALRTWKELLAEGTVTPIIDKVFPLAQTADAVRYMQGGSANGAIVIRV